MSKKKQFNGEEESFFIALQNLLDKLPKGHEKRFPRLKSGIEALRPKSFPKFIAKAEYGCLGRSEDYTGNDLAITCYHCGAEGLGFHSDETIACDDGSQMLYSVECEECGEYTTVDNHMCIYETYGVIYD